MTDSDRPLPNIQDLGPRFLEFLEGLQRPVVFFDIESTGTDTQRDRIIELCLLRVSPLPVAVEPPKTWRVNPTVRIPAESTRVHGIVDADVASAPTFAEIADEVISMIEGCDLAGFNISRFDIRMLQQELVRADKRFDLSRAQIVDAQVIFHKNEPRNLSAALKFYCDDELVDAHGAAADTIATLRVFAGQLARYEHLASDVGGLHELVSAMDAAYVDKSRRFVWRDNEPSFNFGKLRGKSLRAVASDPSERDYLRWIVQGSFEEDVKQLIRDALDGTIRTNKPAS
ncbi:MAG: exonuclease domain-containing protein [Nannocystaceae bacterium]